MQKYQCHKVVNAEPMTRGEYNVFRGWTIPENENPADAGYLVEYPDGGPSNHTDFANCISWSPASVFENGYSEIHGDEAKTIIAMNFGEAIQALKNGRKVARKGWNGRDMWLLLVNGTPKANLRQGTPYRVALGQEECEILPHIDMWTVNAAGRRAMLPGWLASQSDMLANDWVLVD